MNKTYILLIYFLVESSFLVIYCSKYSKTNKRPVRYTNKEKYIRSKSEKYKNVKRTSYRRRRPSKGHDPSVTTRDPHRRDNAHTSYHDSGGPRYGDDHDHHDHDHDHHRSQSSKKKSHHQHVVKGESEYSGDVRSTHHEMFRHSSDYYSVSSYLREPSRNLDYHQKSSHKSRHITTTTTTTITAATTTKKHAASYGHQKRERHHDTPTTSNATSYDESNSSGSSQGYIYGRHHEHQFNRNHRRHASRDFLAPPEADVPQFRTNFGHSYGFPHPNYVISSYQPPPIIPNVMAVGNLNSRLPYQDVDFSSGELYADQNCSYGILDDGIYGYDLSHQVLNDRDWINCLNPYREDNKDINFNRGELYADQNCSYGILNDGIYSYDLSQQLLNYRDCMNCFNAYRGDNKIIPQTPFTTFALPLDYPLTLPSQGSTQDFTDIPTDSSPYSSLFTELAPSDLCDVFPCPTKQELARSATSSPKNRPFQGHGDEFERAFKRIMMEQFSLYTNFTPQFTTWCLDCCDWDFGRAANSFIYNNKIVRRISRKAYNL